MQDSKLIYFLQTLIQKESITPNECGIYTLIKEILYDFKAIEVEKNGVKNLFLYKDFGEFKKDSKHLCFGGHIDVVPSGEDWSHSPFGGVIENGVIFGRGAQDMKGGVASFIFALKEIKNFNGRLSILLTSDEEGDGIYGTKIMLDELKRLDLLPDFAIVAEPTCEKILGDTIKIGRRGSINGILKLSGIQGHVAYPDKCLNPIDLIAPLLSYLSSKALDSGDNNFSASKIIITDIRSGMEVVNVTPSDLKLMFNVRNSPLTDKDALQKYISDVFGDIKFDLELKQSSYPFITDSKILIDSLSKSIKNTTSLNPNLSTSGGTSDARYFSAFGVEVVEFGLVNDRIHAIDECANLQDIINLKNIFVDFIGNLDSYE
ncbi:MAG: succinyl-diaminopimelate desuccinylase [Helicobacteraceae bacterium]|nr:succinyl-diaminopimelate desuccinylase [Helicobacteraceae bacterium]